MLHTPTVSILHLGEHQSSQHCTMLFPIVASAISIFLFITFVHVLELNGIYNYFFGKRFNPATDIPDLTGKVILVTGGKFMSIVSCTYHSVSDSLKATLAWAMKQSFIWPLEIQRRYSWPPAIHPEPPRQSRRYKPSTLQ